MVAPQNFHKFQADQDKMSVVLLMIDEAVLLLHSTRLRSIAVKSIRRGGQVLRALWGKDPFKIHSIIPYLGYLNFHAHLSRVAYLARHGAMYVYECDQGLQGRYEQTQTN